MMNIVATAGLLTWLMTTQGIPQAIVAWMQALDMTAFGFLLLDLDNKGVIPAGMVRKPTDVATCVQDATGAAMRALTQE